jgi:hypothetical protein
MTVNHISDAEISRYVSGEISQHERDALNQHLMICPGCQNCLAEAFAEGFERDGERWWAEYVWDQVSHLLVLLTSEELDQILSELGIQRPNVVFVGSEPIQLPVLSPEASRMCPIDGWGFVVQTILAPPPR